MLGSLFINRRSPTYSEFCGVCRCLTIASCNILDRGLRYYPDHLVWVWSYPLLCLNFIEQHLIRVGFFPFALKFEPHRLGAATRRTNDPVGILLSFNLSRLMVFCVVGKPRIGLNICPGNAVAIGNLSFPDYPLNYCTSVG